MPRTTRRHAFARGASNMQQFLFESFAMCLLLSCSAPLVGAATPSFQEAGESALAFRHISPISPERHLHLFMGSGVGWADFDRDEQLDLMFCQGTPVPSTLPLNSPPALRVWRGERGQFSDCSTAARLHGATYAFGLTIADFNHDGFADVFVTGLLTAALYENNGDGSFTDRTNAAGIVPSGFGTGCCWTDFDQDGHLDLIYVRYITIPQGKYPLCTAQFRGRAMPLSCNPRHLTGDGDSLYRSRGDGTFEDVSAKGGFATGPLRQGLGCVALDLDDDGACEIYVANDSSPNELWTRTNDGRLEERGLLAGVALNRYGAAEAGMGIAVGDVDGDLRPELFVTNYFNETNTLYRNEGNLLFLDVTEEVALAAPSRQRLGFGTNLVDFDNDGWLDLFVANGHVHDDVPLQMHPGETFAQLSQLFSNREGRRFDDASQTAGAYFQQPTVARGSAVADFDDDGREDLAIVRLNGPAALLRNTSQQSDHWLAIELRGTESNRDAIGASVIVRAGRKAWRRDRMASSSYLSCDAPRLHFGLGDQTAVDSIEVRWPTGKRELFPTPDTGRTTTLVEGTGRPVARPPR